MKTKKPRVCVIDGLGGGIGAVIIKRLKEIYGEEIEVIALGINVLATAQMLKARANQGASGENAIVVTVPTADVIIGTISIIMANAMLGEVTPKMAAAIGSAPAHKILLPLTQERVEVVGVSREPLPHLVEIAVAQRLPEVLRTLYPAFLSSRTAVPGLTTEADADGG
jgi:hypothetical protein